MRPELLRLAKRGTNHNCQPAVRSRRLITQVSERHREPQGRTGPIHRSPATEAEDGSREDGWRRERPLTVRKDEPVALS